MTIDNAKLSPERLQEIRNYREYSYSRSVIEELLAHIQALERERDEAKQQVIENDKAAGAWRERAEAAEASLAQARREGMLEGESIILAEIARINSLTLGNDVEVIRVQNVLARLAAAIRRAAEEGK